MNSDTQTRTVKHSSPAHSAFLLPRRAPRSDDHASARGGSHRTLIFGALVVAASLGPVFAGCSTKTADLELDAARKAMDDASRRKANDCATETFKAAETALAEAQALASDGKIEAARSKAVEAQTLAEQAAAASPPGCDTPPEPEPTADAVETTDASRDLALEADLKNVIYFDYNDASIREDSRAALSRIASALQRSRSTSIEVEGHCDVRGSTEYNLHLGERRAASVRKYLVAQGAEPNQVAIISYGEERPLDLGTSEEAHAKNRRAEIKRR